MRRRACIACAAAFAGACGPEPIAGSDEASGDSTAAESSTTIVGTTVADASSDGGTAKLDAGPPACARTDPPQLDLLVLVENTPAMAAVQQRFAASATRIVRALETALDASGDTVVVDVQLMFTTTDLGNPLCAGPPGYAPLGGTPLATGCNTRIAEFGAQPEVCTAACPSDLVPGESFIAFVGEQATNVLDVPPVDVDGDGELDSPAAQAAACLAPAGLVGCDYASPLEAMRAALDPAAPWNQGDRPFLREHAALAILIVEDGFDCSLADSSVMMDPAFQEIDLQTGVEAPSQAICWNAGVTCDGPDADGVYASCTSSGEALHPVARYADFLASEVGDPECKRTFMIAAAGVPPVTEHDPNPPYVPIEGGLLELVYHDWRDDQFPEGDILPADWAQGVPGAQKQFEYGIGPGCTVDDARSGFTAQALPDPRLFEVCRSLDWRDGAGVMNFACCIESVCDTSDVGVLHCLTGLMFPAIGGGPWFPPD